MAKTNKTTSQKSTTEKKQKVEGAAEKKVRLYLEARAKEDPEFAKMYANPKKNIANALQYAKECAKKQAANGCAFCDDDEVFGWIVHYYNEPDVEPKGNVKATMGTSDKPTEVVKAVAQTVKKTTGKCDAEDLLDALDSLEL